MNPNLFDSFSLSGMQLKNRIVMAPMCQYSVTTKDGRPNEWHYIHYLSRAIGGTGLIIMEMTDVEPDGRITDYDLGLWSDEQISAFSEIVEGVHRYDAKIGIQLAHAGRKAEDTKIPVAPSAIGLPGPKYKMPRALSTEEVVKMVQLFGNAARRAVEAGFDTIEIHGAHGYLIHQFHSPLSNQREDEYGRDLSRFGKEVIQAVKREMPKHMPLIFRISAVEYADGGYGIDHAIALCKLYQEAGVDVFHVSSGGEGPTGTRRPGTAPGYQVGFARQIRQATGAPVIAVGMLEDPELAQSVVSSESADLVALARGMLRDPYWAAHAALKLNYGYQDVPKQYRRAYE